MLVRGTASVADLKTATDRLAVVGSRVFVARVARRHVERVVRHHLSTPRPQLFISGGADGIDVLAEWIADELGIPTLIFLPEQQVWPANNYVAANCTRLVRIACAYAKTYGSGWTRDRALERLGPERIKSYIIDEYGAHIE